MKFKQISKLEDEEFRRLTGVKRGTFKKMIEILIEAEVKKKARDPQFWISQQRKCRK